MVNESVTAAAKLRQADDAFNSISAVVFAVYASSRKPLNRPAHALRIFTGLQPGADETALLLNSFRAGGRFVQARFDEGREVITVASLLHLLDGNETKRSRVDAVP